MTPSDPTPTPRPRPPPDAVEPAAAPPAPVARTRPAGRGGPTPTAASPLEQPPAPASAADSGCGRRPRNARRTPRAAAAAGPPRPAGARPCRRPRRRTTCRRIAQDLQIRKAQVEAVVQLLDEEQHRPVHHPLPQGADRRAGRGRHPPHPGPGARHLRDLADRKQTILRSIAYQGRLTDELVAADPRRPSTRSGSKTCTCRSSRRSGRWPPTPGRRGSNRSPWPSGTATRPSATWKRCWPGIVDPWKQLPHPGRRGRRGPAHPRRGRRRDWPRSAGRCGCSSGTRPCSRRPRTRRCRRGRGRSTATTSTSRSRSGSSRRTGCWPSTAGEREQVLRVQMDLDTQRRPGHRPRQPAAGRPPAPGVPAPGGRGRAGPAGAAEPGARGPAGADRAGPGRTPSTSSPGTCGACCSGRRSAAGGCWPSTPASAPAARWPCWTRPGTLLEDAVIYPHPPQKKAAEAKRKLEQLIRKYQTPVIAIGNGTACRETEQLVADLIARARAAAAEPGPGRVRRARTPGRRRRAGPRRPRRAGQRHGRPPGRRPTPGRHSATTTTPGRPPSSR